jgi:3,4-dihydroxy 2-butanone 4-phosphate synthase/GTP cyclohydrolase II
MHALDEAQPSWWGHDVDSLPVGLSPIETAIEAIAAGEMVVVVDAAERENEGDLVMAAGHVTPDAINFMATHGRGLVCVALPEDRLAELQIDRMVAQGSDPLGTAFHVSVDHRFACSTGISASDRAATIRALIDPGSMSGDFTRPGHVFPLASRPGGVLARPGHTEASVDLAVLAGLEPGGVICEIARPDGEMARLPELLEFAARHGIPLISIADLVAYRRRHQQAVVRCGEARLPLPQGTFTAIAYRDEFDGLEHLALTMGTLEGDEPPLVRVHSECMTGDILGSRRCDCGRQLELSLEEIAAVGRGAVVYLRGHEGRGIGLGDKLRAYQLQEEGLDTVEANHALGHPSDLRDYRVAAQVLDELGVTRVRLLTNSPAKQLGLEAYGVTVVDRIGLETVPTAENVRYLETKRDRLGHILHDARRFAGA